MLNVNLEDSGIAVVTIDDPRRSMNVLSWEMCRNLGQAFENLVSDPAVTGIVLTSGKTSFVAGADLSEMSDFRGDSGPAAAQRIAALGDMMRDLETCGKPVVAAAPGTALGGGFELMLACHYRIAAFNSEAVFGLPEVKLGLLPAAGGTQRLPRLIGIPKALPLLISGRHLAVEETLELGLIHEAVESDRLLEAAREAILAGRVSAEVAWDKKKFALPGPTPQSREVADLMSITNGQVLAETRDRYPAPKAILSCVWEGARLPIDKALKIEREYFATLITGEVAHSMIHSLFFGRLGIAKLSHDQQHVLEDYKNAGRNAYIDAALNLRQKGVSASLIENAALSFGMRDGPLALALAANVAVPETDEKTTMTVHEVQRHLVDTQVSAASRSRNNLSSEVADYAAISGWGFPAWTGGPIRLSKNMEEDQFDVGH